MTTKKVKLGATSLEIAPIIFGGNVFGWTLDQQESFRILDEFIDLGFNALDTSNNYSHWVDGNVGTESERIIGQWLKSRNNRENVIIATKVGGRNLIQSSPNTTKAHIIKEVEDSLMRLNTDYIDLYQTHYDDEKTPVEETLSAYDRLIQQGKVRYIGASNISAIRLEESLEKGKRLNLPIYKTLQPEYNVLERQKFEEFYLPVAQQYQLAVLPYYSLASGFLTGKYQHPEDLNQSLRGSTVEKYMNPHGFAVLSAIELIKNKYDASYAAVALAWLMHQETVVAPIASGTKREHLKAFVDAVDLNLTKEDLALLASPEKLI